MPGGDRVSLCDGRKIAADRLSDAGIDRHVRSWEKPSDHVPVWIDLDIETK
jgi:exonuclease III